MIVTATSADGTLRSVPHGVSVITADDIARSTASTVGDLISREANVNLKSFYGSDKNTSVDLRGMGDTAVSNVLILVDGVRLNELDLSGADLTTVPLSQIERIEIIRGGGAVKYGDGAVGGVINIITRRGTPGPITVEAQVTRGSYQLWDERLHVRGGTGPIAWSVNLNALDTDGFRRNGDLRSRNIAGEVRLLAPGPLDFLDAFVRVAHHTDHYGFPGPVSADKFAAGTSARRSTDTPNDRGSTDDTVYTTGASADFERAGKLSLQTSYRDRTNPYVLGYTPLLSRQEQQAEILSKRHDFQLRYDNDLRLFGKAQTISAGLNRETGSYERYSGGRSFPGTDQKAGDIRNEGAFVAATMRPAENWAINAGFRKNHFRTKFSDNRFDNSCTLVGGELSCSPYAYVLQGQRQGNWRNHGSEVGLTWSPTRALTAFANRTEHFRNPNIDELALASDDLRPQAGRTLETGLRWSPNKNLELGATLFDILVHDEIYYGADPSSGLSANRNYELATRRKGAELEARWQVSPSVSLRANTGYVKPQFEGTDADIPNVPRRNANLQVEWRFIEQARWSTSIKYVGRRYDGNDQTNRDWPTLASYTVVDMTWRFDWSGFELAAGINNLFNRAYSTLAYSATYYPMPQRNGYVQIRFKT